MKAKETLKQVAERLASTTDEFNMFIAGAKWQEQRMYSEEEVEEIFKQAQLCAVKSDGVYFKYETFEQFKKK
jgi:hypothetical protein